MLPQTHSAPRAFWSQAVTEIQFIQGDFQSHTCLWDYSVPSHIKTPKIWPSELLLLITSGSLIPPRQADELDKVSLRTGFLTETDKREAKPHCKCPFGFPRWNKTLSCEKPQRTINSIQKNTAKLHTVRAPTSNTPPNFTALQWNNFLLLTTWAKSVCH